MGGEARKGSETSQDVGPDPELAGGLARSVFGEGTGRWRGNWQMQRMEWGEAGDWEIYYNYLILSPAATVTFYGAPVIFQAEHLHSFPVSSLTPSSM